MDVSDYSDAEIKQSLQEFGVTCGPLTSTTRAVYAKKLSKLIATSSSQSEPEVVQARQTISDEDFYSSEETVTTRSRSGQQIKKIIELDTTDAPMPKLTTNISAPRSYTPDGSNLTRRPLSTPHRPATKVSSIQTTSTSAITNSTGNKKGILSYCRYLLPVLVVLILLMLLVYYHMEEGGFKELTSHFK